MNRFKDTLDEFEVMIKLDTKPAYNSRCELDKETLLINTDISLDMINTIKEALQLASKELANKE